jgi:hypothetical protein
MPQSFVEIIDRFGGPAAFAREVGMSSGAAKQARRRRSLSAKWFDATVAAARVRGFKDITPATLAKLAATTGEASA